MEETIYSLTKNKTNTHKFFNQLTLSFILFFISSIFCSVLDRFICFCILSSSLIPILKISNFLKYFKSPHMFLLINININYVLVISLYSIITKPFKQKQKNFKPTLLDIETSFYLFSFYFLKQLKTKNIPSTKLNIFRLSVRLSQVVCVALFHS